MGRSTFSWVLASALMISNQSARAVDISLSEMNGRKYVFMSGRIELEDRKKFIDTTLPLEEATIVLSSPGGNLYAGIEIGKAIKLKGFTTLVQSSQECASACALAWLGGFSRQMEAGAKVGFHAASNATNGEVTSSGNAVVGAYVSQLGLPERAVIYVTEAAPASITWLSPADARRVGIDLQVVQGMPSPPRSPATVATPTPPPATQAAPGVAAEPKPEAAGPERAALCLVEVDGVHQMGGPCSFQPLDKIGSFVVTDSRNPSLRATVRVQKKGEGVILVQGRSFETFSNKACWEHSGDSDTRVCAWRPTDNVYVGPSPGKRTSEGRFTGEAGLACIRRLPPYRVPTRATP